MFLIGCKQGGDEIFNYDFIGEWAQDSIKLYWGDYSSSDSLSTILIDWAGSNPIQNFAENYDYIVNILDCNITPSCEWDYVSRVFNRVQ